MIFYFFWKFWENVRWGKKTCFLTVLGINFEEKCWPGKVLIFLFFGHWAKTFRSDSNICIPIKEDFDLLMQRIFFGEHIFKKRCNLHFLGFWAKIVKRPANRFRRNCKNCILRFQRNNVGVYFFWEKYHLLFFLGFEKNFLVFRGTFSMRKFFYRIYKFILLFGLGVEDFSAFQHKLSDWVVKTEFYRSWKSLRREIFLKVHSFIINFGLFKKIFDLSSGFCRNVVIYALYLSEWTFRARWFPWKFYEFVWSSGLWAQRYRSCDKKSFSSVVKTLFYLSRGSFLGNKIYTEKKIVL